MVFRFRRKSSPRRTDLSRLWRSSRSLLLRRWIGKSSTCVVSYEFRAKTDKMMERQPVDQFLVHYSLDMPPTPSYVSDWSERFTVKATNVVLHSIDRTKSFTIEVQHPSLIWPVITFEADIVSWELPTVERGRTQHHVKVRLSILSRNTGLTRYDRLFRAMESLFSLSISSFNSTKRNSRSRSSLTK